jgi:predicted TPR repeat methyltransferase
MLGIAYNQLGRHAEAAEVYRAWLQDEPDHPIAAHLLAASQGDGARQRASDAYLQAYFDGFADSFEGKLLGALGYRVPTAVNEAVRALEVPPRSLRVLDLGCGTGLCGVELAPFAQWMAGVDLSAKSLDKARSKGVYDQLVHGEIVEHLASAAASAYDLVVAADTLIYFGEIEGLVRGVGHVLAPGGWFIASLEVLSAGASTPYAIQPSGRYSHRLDHVRQVLADAGMQLLRASPLNLRHELGRPVQGLLVVGQRGMDVGN